MRKCKVHGNVVDPQNLHSGTDHRSDMSDRQYEELVQSSSFIYADRPGAQGRFGQVTYET